MRRQAWRTTAAIASWIIASGLAVLLFAAMTLELLLWAEGHPGGGEGAHLRRALIPGVYVAIVLALSAFRWRDPTYAGWARVAGGAGVVVLGGFMTGLAELWFLLPSDAGHAAGHAARLPSHVLALGLLFPCAGTTVAFVVSVLRRSEKPMGHIVTWTITILAVAASLIGLSA